MGQEGQHSTAQPSPTWYRQIQHNHSTAQDGTAGHGTAQHSTAHHSMWIVCQECNFGQVQLACAYPFLQFIICANDYMRVCVSSQPPAAAACCHSCLLTIAMQAVASTVATPVIPIKDEL